MVLHFQEMKGTLKLLLGRFIEKVVDTLQSHIFSLEVEAQREVG